MKLRVFRKRNGIRRLNLTACFGPVMWRCATGHPTYRTEWEMHAHVAKDYIKGRYYVTPTFIFDAWHKCISSCSESLGTIHHWARLEIAWWRWSCWVTISRTNNTKTEDELEKVKWGI